MNTIRTFIPSDSVASFKKFANKTQKNVLGFSYTISEPYMKVFLHPVIKDVWNTRQCDEGLSRSMRP